MLIVKVNKDPLYTDSNIDALAIARGIIKNGYKSVKFEKTYGSDPFIRKRTNVIKTNVRCGVS